jgi:hypothetical protein
MSFSAVHLPNGTSSNTSVLRFFGAYLSGSGVVPATAMTVSAQASPDMSVKISGSAAADNLIIKTTSGEVYHVWNTASANVTITANSSGVAKTDAIVVYVDTALSSATPDNPAGGVAIAVRRSGTNTGIPTNAEIDTATGSKPWYILTTVAVASGATSINSGNITDKRAITGFDGAQLAVGSVTADRMAAETWTQFTPTWSTSGTAPSIGNGTLTGYYRKVGRDVDVQIILKPGSTTTFGSLTWFFTYPVVPHARYAANPFVIGDAYAIDTSAGKAYGGIIQSYDATRFVPELTDSTNAAYIQGLTPSLPFTWANSDTLSMCMRYEAAS